MSTARPKRTVASRNTVSLAGRVCSAPVEREMPSGDRVVTFRLVMPRERTPMTAGSRQVSDWVVCAAWSGRVRRSVKSWRTGDLVEVEGALRRRFYRNGEGAASSLEVEAVSARCLERGPARGGD